MRAGGSSRGPNWGSIAKCHCGVHSLIGDSIKGKIIDVATGNKYQGKSGHTSYTA